MGGEENGEGLTILPPPIREAVVRKLPFPETKTHQRPMDLKTESGVVELMKSSTSQEEWNANCDKVKAANGGYPDFWYSAIVLSGVMAAVMANV